MATKKKTAAKKKSFSPKERLEGNTVSKKKLFLDVMEGIHKGIISEKVAQDIMSE